MTDRYPPALAIVGGLIVAASSLGDWQADDLGAIGIGVDVLPVGLALAVVFVALGLARWQTTIGDRAFAVAITAVAVLSFLLGGVGYAEVIGADVSGLEELGALLAPVGVIAGAAVGTIGAASAWFEVDAPTARARARATLAMLLVGFGGLLAMFIWSQVLLVPMVAMEGTTDLPMGQLLIASNVSLGLGMATAALAYLTLADRDWSFIDLRRPTLLDVAYTVVGVGGLLVAMIGVSIILQLLGAPTAEHGLVEDIVEEGDPELLLYILIPASILLIGPGEELLFRNIIQKSLYEYFSKPASVVVASLVFALAHIPAYWAGADTVTALVVISILSLLLGAIYVKTENIIVPAVIHGLYNAILFAGLYVEMTMDTDALALLAATVGL